MTQLLITCYHQLKDDHRGDDQPIPLVNDELVLFLINDASMSDDDISHLGIQSFSQLKHYVNGCMFATCKHPSSKCSIHRPPQDIDFSEQAAVGKSLVEQRFYCVPHHDKNKKVPTSNEIVHIPSSELDNGSGAYGTLVDFYRLTDAREPDSKIIEVAKIKVLKSLPRRNLHDLQMVYETKEPEYKFVLVRDIITPYMISSAPL
eukprot:Nk52_evm25s230 gene=Nk52_evmTU25s230